MAWTSLCEIDELTPGQGKAVQVDGFELAVFLRGGRVYVMDNRCPHAGRDIAGGYVDDDGCAICPWHGWAFHVETGGLRDAPGVTIRTYPVRLRERDGRPALVQADLPTF